MNKDDVKDALLWKFDELLVEYSDTAIREIRSFYGKDSAKYVRMHLDKTEAMRRDFVENLDKL